ncbi:type II secretion system protein N [Petrachloros mirabilis]
MSGHLSMRRLMQVLNTALALGALGLAVPLGNSLLAHQSFDAQALFPELEEQKRHPSAVAEESHAVARLSLPPLEEFQIIVNRDPFRKLEEPVAVKPALAPIPKAAVPKPPLPPLSVTLSGTVMFGDERKAILKDGKQEELYMVGQSVGGGVLEKIDDDRVVIDRGGQRTVLLLRGAVESADAPGEGTANPDASGQNLMEKPASTEASASVSQEKNRRPVRSNRPTISTPAFARYPGVN